MDSILTVVLDEDPTATCNWYQLHQCLLMLFDSPLNQAGYLEVLIRLADSRVIKMHREGCDMPVVQTKDGHTKLLQFVGKLKDSNNCHKYRISNLAPRLTSAEHFTSSLEKVTVFIEFGGVNFNILGEGRETEYEIKTINKYPDEDTYSISRYPLAAALICVKLTTSFEKALDVF